MQQHEYHYDLMPHFSLKYQLLGLHLSLNRISKLDCCDQLGLCWRVWSPVLNLLRIIIYPSEVEKDRCLFCWLLICWLLKSIPAFYPSFISIMTWFPLNYDKFTVDFVQFSLKDADPFADSLANGVNIDISLSSGSLLPQLFSNIRIILLSLLDS